MLCKKCNKELTEGTKYCPECGAATHAKKKKRSKPTKPRPRKKHSGRPPASQKQSIDGGYDGYYDNIKPADKGNIDLDGLDKTTIKKVALVASGAAAIIIACVILLQVL